MNIQIHVITLAISFIILYLSYKISINQDKLTNKIDFDYGSKGYLCGTCADGKSKLVTSPTGTYFTKFIFADYGKPGSNCPQDVGPENLPLKSSNCTLPNTLPISPFTYLSDNIHGKSTIIVSATPDFFGINLTCGSFFTYVLEYTYAYSGHASSTQSSTQAPTDAPTQAPTQSPTQAPTQSPTQELGTNGPIYLLLMMIGICLFKIFSIILLL